MKHLFKQFLQREAHPLIQFIKYGIAGGLATLVHVIIFSYLAWKVFPALKEGEWVVRLFALDVPMMEEGLRTRNYAICSVITFLFSNFVAYIVNIYWVFEPGRHSKHKEVVLFYSVSIVSFLIGLGVGTGLIAIFDLSTAVAFMANLVASVMINYVCRKYIVFKN